MKTNNNQKQVSTYVKLFQEKLKQEEDLKNNSNINQSKKEQKNYNQKNKETDDMNNVIKTKKGINFDELSDWDAPALSNLNKDNNIIQNPITNNLENNIINIDDVYSKNIPNQNLQFNNNIISDLKNNDDDSDDDQISIRGNKNLNIININPSNKYMNNNINNNNKNNNYNNINQLQNNNNNNNLNNFNQFHNNNNNNNFNQNNNYNNFNNLDNLSLNTSNFTYQQNEMINYDKIDLSVATNNDNIIGPGKKVASLFNENLISQIKKDEPINQFNHVIKEEEDEYSKYEKDSLSDDYDINAHKDIMNQAEKENDILMKQFDDLAKEADGYYGAFDNKKTGKFGPNNFIKNEDLKMKNQQFKDINNFNNYKNINYNTKTSNKNNMINKELNNNNNNGSNFNNIKSSNNNNSNNFKNNNNNNINNIKSSNNNNNNIKTSNNNNKITNNKFTKNKQNNNNNPNELESKIKMGEIELSSPIKMVSVNQNEITNNPNNQTFKPIIENNINTNLTNINNMSNAAATFKPNEFDQINPLINNNIPNNLNDNINNNLNNNISNNNITNINSVTFNSNINKIQNQNININPQINPNILNNNNNINPQINPNIMNNNNINPQIIQNSNLIFPQMQFPTTYISPYPYSMPFNMPNQIPIQNPTQYNMQNINYNISNNNLMQPISQRKITTPQSKKQINKSVNYKPKSLKEYKEKYVNDKNKNKERGGLGPNIGTKEWEKKERNKNKVKEYSEKIKEKNEEKENKFKNQLKINKENSRIVKDQLYDSLSEKDEIDDNLNINLNNLNNENKINENTNERRIQSASIKQINTNNGYSRIGFLKHLAQENEEKKKKFTNYKKTKINKEEDNKTEIKLGRIYTTLKQPQQNQINNKKNINNNKNNNFQTPFDKQRAKSSKVNNRVKKQIINYEDDITKKFMKNEANEYNGLIKDNKGNLIMDPAGEIEHLLQNNRVFNSKVNQIKNFLSNMK